MTSQATRSISVRYVFGWFNAKRFHYRYRWMHQCTSSVEAGLLSTNARTLFSAHHTDRHFNRILVSATSKLNSVRKTWRRRSDRSPKTPPLTTFEPFQVPSNAGLAHFPAKKGVQNVGIWCPDGGKKNKLAYFDVFSPPTVSKKKNQLPRHVVRDLTYPPFFFSCKSSYRPWTQKNLECPKKTVIFCNKKKVGAFFPIL